MVLSQDKINRLKELEDFFNVSSHMKDRPMIRKYFGMTLKFEILDDDEIISIVKLPYNPNLDHGLGGVHGGIFATLVDIAGWFVCAAHVDSKWIATADLNIRYLLPVKEKELIAKGYLVKKGKRLLIAEMKLYDDDHNLVCTSTGSFVNLPNIK